MEWTGDWSGLGGEWGVQSAESESGVATLVERSRVRVWKRWYGKGMAEALKGSEIVEESEYSSGVRDRGTRSVDDELCLVHPIHLNRVRPSFHVMPGFGMGRHGKPSWGL